DGIRDFHVTGVQTCALPIFRRVGMVPVNNLSRGRQPVAVERFQKNRTLASFYLKAWDKLCLGDATTLFISASYLIEKHASKEIRSEERRVGKEGRLNWIAEQ